MPIRPNPFTFECGDCGWKKTEVPKSDCLGSGGLVRTMLEMGEQRVENAYGQRTRAVSG